MIVSLQVPDGLKDDLLAAVRSQLPQYADVPNRDLAQTVLADHLRGLLKAHRAKQARAAAMGEVAAAVQQADAQAEADAALITGG